MNGYKRLTKWSELGTLHIFDFNGKEISLYDVTSLDCDNLAGRLFELEDKIESGELCDRKEVRKETAKEIAEMLKAAKGVVKVHFEAYDELIENIYGKYEIEPVENFDKLEGKE